MPCKDVAMNMIYNEKIDNGRGFDWGRTSDDYARYRDIYPEAFYRKLLELGVGLEGQTVLDIGTGTGVLPRSMAKYGAKFTGIDLSENQIEQAVRLAGKSHSDIDFYCTSAEESPFPQGSFDAITACQCFTYFDHDVLAPHLYGLLKPDGLFAVLYMAWLPFEDRIASLSEELILKYNPSWTGCREERHSIAVPKAYEDFFTVEKEQVFDLSVPFTRESWNGRIKSCRGVEASLSQEEIECFDTEHRQLLEDEAPEQFEVLHYASMVSLRKKPACTAALSDKQRKS